MKVTKQQLQQIIQEELSRELGRQKYLIEFGFSSGRKKDRYERVDDYRDITNALETILELATEHEDSALVSAVQKLIKHSKGVAGV